MSDDTSAAPTPAKPKSSKLMPILLLLNLGATGFVGFTVMNLPREGVAHAQSVAKAVKAKEPGPITSIDPFLVNLNEEGTSRYLKTTFDLEMASKSAVDELQKDKRAVRDELLRYLSSLTVADTLGEKGKDKIQQEIITRINKELGAPAVKHIYFTEFVVQ